jgi:hypothetical protein
VRPAAAISLAIRICFLARANTTYCWVRTPSLIACVLPTPISMLMNFCWNSREARVLMGLFYHRLHANLVVPGEQFTLPKCVGQLFSAITEYNEEVTALKQAMTGNNREARLILLM